MKSNKGLYIIIPIDLSTHFLFDIVSELNPVTIKLIKVEANDNSYSDTLNSISEIPDDSNIIFLGHGTSDKLYGGESESFEKKELVSIRTMRIFKNQNVFLLACNSALLLKSSYRLSNIKKAIGFGSLPTSKEEIDNDKRLSKTGIGDEIIELYKQEIVRITSQGINYFARNKNLDFIDLKNYLDFLLLKRINSTVLKDNNPLLADLLYKMKKEMVIYWNANAFGKHIAKTLKVHRVNQFLQRAYQANAKRNIVEKEIKQNEKRKAGREHSV